MQKNDFRRALILLRPLVRGLSGHVRLERRTLNASLRFSVSGAQSGKTYNAVLLARNGDGYAAHPLGRLQADSRGQAGMTASFDPRNLSGRDINRYDLVCIVQGDAGAPELVMTGMVNGSKEINWGKAHAAATAPYAARAGQGRAAEARDTAGSNAARAESESTARTRGADSPETRDADGSDASRAESESSARTRGANGPETRDADGSDTAQHERGRSETTARTRDEDSSGETQDADESAESRDAGDSDPSRNERDRRESTARTRDADGSDTARNERDRRESTARARDADGSDTARNERDRRESTARARDADDPDTARNERDEREPAARIRGTSSPASPPRGARRATGTDERARQDPDGGAAEAASDREIAAESPPPTGADDEVATESPPPTGADDGAGAAEEQAAQEAPDQPEANARETASDENLPAAPEAPAPEETPDGDAALDSDRRVTAGDLLGVDISRAWPDAVESLRPLFMRLEAIQPFDLEDFVFVEAPLPAESGASGACAIGIRARDGVPVSVCYALPGSYSIDPPPGLEGYDYLGGWWYTVLNALTGDPEEVC